MSPKSDGFKDFVLDQLGDLRNVTARAMFGGYGLYNRDTLFGIIHKDRLYFKVTSKTIDHYKDHGMKPFRPNARQTLKSFYEVPVDVIEDAEALTNWATQAVER
ncbi:MAG: TfoX/Sxy family protein [Nitrospira sp.]|nr:TfoX/Sxy family protein [Nitrospira sp.]